MKGSLFSVGDVSQLTVTYCEWCICFIIYHGIDKCGTVKPRECLPSSAWAYLYTQHCKLHLLGGSRGHRGPCTHREALREPGMLITQGCLLHGRDTSNSCIPPRKLRVDFVNLVTYLLSVEAALTHLLLQRQTSPKFPRTVISDSSLFRPSTHP